MGFRQTSSYLPEKLPANKFLFAGIVPANRFLFAGIVPAYKFLFARIVPANKFLFAGTVPATNLFLENNKVPLTTQDAEFYITIHSNRV